MKESEAAVRGRDRNKTLALLLVPLLLGAALRFWFAWSWRAAPQFPPDLEEGYYGSAIELLGRGLYGDGLGAVQPKAWRGPIYPTFLALVQSVSRHPRLGPPRLAQAALSTLSIALAFALGQAVVSPVAGFIAASALALDPYQIAQVASLNVHGFYSFWLLLLACLALVWIKREGAAASAAILGAAFGASLLCRSSHFPAGFFLLGAGAAWWGTGRRPRRGLAAFCAAALLALAPMAARDAALFSRFLPLPDRDAGSVVFFCGTVPDASGSSCSTVEQAFAIAEAASPGFRAAALADPRGMHPALFDLAVRRIKADPAGYARLCLSRLVRIWRPFGPYLAPALCAALLAPRERALWGVLLIAASFCAYALGGGVNEHMQAVVPLLDVLAGCAAGLAIRRWTRPGPGLHAPRPLPPALLRLAGGLAAGIYAAMLVFLAAETRRYWPPRPEGRAPLEAAAGPLELEALRAAAENGGPDDRRRYVRAAALAAESGGPEDLAGRLIDEAEAAARTGQRAHALSLAARTERLGPLTVERQRRLLRLYRGLKDGARSAALLESLSRSHPGDAELALERAELASESGRRGEALRLAAAAEAGAPSEQARRRLLSLYRGLKDYARASAQLEALSRGRPDDAGLWIERARLAGDFGRSAQARACAARADALLEAAARARPGDPGPWLDKAELAAGSGARGAALSALAQAEKRGLDGDAGGALRRRAALAYQNLGEYGRALEHLAALTRRFPEGASFYGDKGVCESLMGHDDAALQDLRTAVRLDARSLPAALSLGAILERQGRFQEAVGVYDRALASASADDPLREPLLKARAGEKRTSGTSGAAP